MWSYYVSKERAGHLSILHHVINDPWLVSNPTTLPRPFQLQQLPYKRILQIYGNMLVANQLVSPGKSKAGFGEDEQQIGASGRPLPFQYSPTTKIFCRWGNMNIHWQGAGQVAHYPSLPCQQCSLFQQCPPLSQHIVSIAVDKLHQHREHQIA
jgi:hypothetical protein